MASTLLGPVLRDLEDVLELEVSAVVVVNKLYKVKHTVKKKTNSEVVKVSSQKNKP